MAIASVPTTPNLHTGLTLEQVDRLADLFCQTKAIVDLIRAVPLDSGDLPDDAIPGACWAVTDKIDEIQVILAAGRQ